METPDHWASVISTFPWSGVRESPPYALGPPLPAVSQDIVKHDLLKEREDGRQAGLSTRGLSVLISQVTGVDRMDFC